MKDIFDVFVFRFFALFYSFRFSEDASLFHGYNSFWFNSQCCFSEGDTSFLTDIIFPFVLTFIFYLLKVSHDMLWCDVNYFYPSTWIVGLL